MGILNKFFEHTNIVLLCTKEFIQLTEEYDKLQEVADNKFKEIMEYVSSHPNEFATVKNIGEESAKEERASETDNQTT